MTKKQDARPFVDLKKDAEDFQEKFNEDIRECIDFLDNKITDLICDPDSLGKSTKSISTNALVEFSKAKYDIFMSVKSLINTKEREWITYISEMKKLFIENVEIFLAGTKLEVKLPSSEYQSSFGSRKSPGNRKSLSSSVTSSLLNTITKNIPGLGSPFYKEESSRNVFKMSNVEDEVQFNRRGRLSASSAKLYESSALKSAVDEMDIDDQDLNLSRSRRSSSLKSRKSSSSDLNTSLTSPTGRDSLKQKLNTESKKPRQVLKPKQANIKATNEKSSSDETEENNMVEMNNQPVKVRRGRAAAKNKVNDSAVNDLKSAFMDKDEKNEKADKGTVHVPVRGRRGRIAKGANGDDFIVCNAKSNTSDEDEKIVAVDTDQMPEKAPRGRAAAKKKTNISAVSKINSNSSEEKQKNVEDEENVSCVPLKRSREKTTRKNNASDSANSQVKSSTSDENEKINNAIETNQMPVKAPRGRAAAKIKTNKSADSKVSSVLSDEKEKNDENEESIISKSSAVKATEKNKANDSSAIQNTRRKRATRAGRIPESDSSRSPEKDSDESDDIALPTALSRPSTSTIRRKTLLPNLVELSDNEIMPGNSTRSTKSKRKTIASSLYLEAALPSKRLKVSSKKSSQVEEADAAAADNLLDNDNNYSEWMALKAVDGKVPPRPGIYEMKVWRAKKPAYIGDCESLRQKLTLHKMKQNSGHKHLDKFVERNFDEIQVRFEVVSSVSEAKAEAKNRIKSFVAQHKTTPAYN